MRKLIKKATRYILTPFILGDYWRFKILIKKSRFKLSLKDSYPCVTDKTIKTGFDRHYVYHTAWAARKLAETKPAFHTDISSSLYFSGIVSAFVPVKFYDYRPAELSLSNLTSERADLLNLPFKDASINSLSCMHVVEHVGLGRYGEEIDSEADLKAIGELCRVLATGGNIFFVVPVGQPRIEYNAHRIYSYEQIVGYFSKLSLKEFTLIPENNGIMISQASKEQADKEHYGCGCFWFVKTAV
ncbi:MAG: DUF268 domain-containing protein [Candidatus Magasanikbacteria bacterium]